MGSSLIFDKSLLESLNPDEAMWLDNFFLCNITPLFYVETLADLEKNVRRKGKKAEDIVGSIAYKTPDANSKCNVHHMALLSGELTGGSSVEMSMGRPIISGGTTLELEGKQGVIFNESPEEEAFQRWQQMKFLELERLQAKQWRKSLSNLDLTKIHESYQIFFPMGKPKTLSDVNDYVNFYLNGPDQRAILQFGLNILGVPIKSQITVFSRWNSQGKPLIKDFAPYFTYVFKVDLFFNIAIAADLIGHGRSSHKVDLAYLYYLPFCMVFTSNDKLHLNLAPFFLRDDQTFIKGEDLKKDLAKLDAHYVKLPEEEKKKGVMSFAFYPPNKGDFIVSNLWDKYMNPKWREHQIKPKPQLESDAGKEFKEKMEEFQEKGKVITGKKALGSDMADHVIVKRQVRAKKGKWDRFPPEVLKSNKKNE